MKKARTTLTGQELEIMKVIWKLGTPTVRQVYETLLEHPQGGLHHRNDHDEHPGDRRDISRSARATGRSSYTPSQPEKQVIRDMVREFVDRVFNGAAEPLLLHLVEDDQLTKEELDEIRRSIGSAPGSAGEKRRS